MTVGEIEKILSVYPWFAFARKELLIKMSSLGDEYRNDALRRTNLYIYPEKEPFIQSYVTSLESIDSSEFVGPVYELDYFDSVTIDESLKHQGSSAPTIADHAEQHPLAEDSAQTRKPVEKEVKREVYIVGGDYFSNSDFEGLSKDGMDSFNLLIAPQEQSPKEEFIASEFKDEFYYTETLARIYAEQELYERAIEVYDKLILLYPEKSAYFAAFKSEIKKHL